MQPEPIYLLLADLILVLHTLIIIFIVGALPLILAGGYCHWSWVTNPWFRCSHLAAILCVMLQAWVGRLCPLTVWESGLRRAGGSSGYDSSFIAYWLGRLIYFDAPAVTFLIAYTLFALAVVLAWVLVRPRPFRSGN